MKRYLTSYSKNRLTVRDRLTGQSASESFVDADTAEIIQNRIKETNYTLPNKKNQVKNLSIDECIDWFKSVDKNFKADFGWIQPDKIKWETKKEQIKTTLNNIEDSIKELNRILEIE